MVEFKPGYAGLYPTVEIFVVDLDDLVHLAQVDAHAAFNCLHLSFQRSTGAKGNNRCAILGTQTNDAGNFLRALGETDRVGCLRWMPGFTVSVLLENRGTGADAITQQSPQLFDWQFAPGNTGCRSTHVPGQSMDSGRNYAAGEGFYHSVDQRTVSAYGNPGDRTYT